MTTARSLADFLAGQAIGVVGLGLIGGSLGLDLRQRGHRVVGVAHRQSTVERALQRGLVDEACLYIAPIFCGAGGVPLVGASLPSSRGLLDASVKRFGQDVRLRGLVGKAKVEKKG